MSEKCPYCGMWHEGICPRVKAIEYEGDGITVKRVEFHEPKPSVTGPMEPFTADIGWPGINTTD